MIIIMIVCQPTGLVQISFGAETTHTHTHTNTHTHTHWREIIGRDRQRIRKRKRKTKRVWGGGKKDDGQAPRCITCMWLRAVWAGRQREGRPSDGEFRPRGPWASGTCTCSLPSPQCLWFKPVTSSRPCVYRIGNVAVLHNDFLLSLLFCFVGWLEGG